MLVMVRSVVVFILMFFMFVLWSFLISELELVVWKFLKLG